ncbi:head decoration protein [Mesorhizobium sp. B1-1-7]|uniref:head decoration protein n=1 Tax=Mesorhizobium sp. B1-1-7 TaxID=2589977 RepID=UPI00112E0A5A|nr:head decoration protein [Mesorhizobium sp. B1-1-7]TPN53988.1 head decoration protein [Mesorhizobium sp. B1-1-7]
MTIDYEGARQRYVEFQEQRRIDTLAKSAAVQTLRRTKADRRRLLWGYPSFLISEEADFKSREAATVAAGQNLVAGQVVEFSAGKLVACSGETDIAGNLVTDVIGILLKAVDATEGDVADCAYVARAADARDDLLKYPLAPGVKRAVVASLKKIRIRARPRRIGE